MILGIVETDPEHDYLIIEGDVFKGLSSRMPDFIKTIASNTLNSAKYTPATKTANCPTPHGDWVAPGPTLPPVPHEELCTCMTSTIDCVGDPVVLGKASQSGDELSEWYHIICGENLDKCPGTFANDSSGAYGAFR